MADRYPSIRPFSTAFAREYKGFMKANDVTQAQIADLLDRNSGYVSERVNGLRPLDTEDVDALAELAGWVGSDLIIELSRRARDAAPGTLGNVATMRPRVAGSRHDADLDEEKYAADTQDEEPDEDLRQP